jgi:hypothetical protein
MSSEGMPTVRLDGGMIQWEYRVAHIPSDGIFGAIFDVDEIGEYLNGVGLEGWELVSLAPIQNNETTNGLIAVLKRQRR